MTSLQDPYVIATLFSLSVGLFVYAFFVPRNGDTYSPHLSEDARKNKLFMLANYISAELYASLPEGMAIDKKRKNPRLQSLLIRSGNPWNLTVAEFKFFQISSAFMGFITGWGIWLLLQTITTVAWWVVIPITVLYGYRLPHSKYNNEAKKRDLEFKRQLPDALDLIIISLSGDITITEAIRQSIPNMKDGVLKNELKNLVTNVDTGKTITEALDSFGSRAPNESIRTFVQAVKESEELNTPIIEVLHSRSEASRAEYFALIHAKVASLSSKMMIILTPTLLPALTIILAAPSVASISTSLTQ